MPPPAAGDMDPREFRDAGTRVMNWAINYLDTVEHRPIGSASSAGRTRSSLSRAVPEEGVPFGRILEEFERVLMPGITHWNHPGFMAYFPSSGSGPGILGEFVTAVLRLAIGHVRTADVHVARAWHSIRATLQELQHEHRASADHS